MGVSKVVLGGNTLIDLTGDTIEEEALLEDETGHNAAGDSIVGKLKVVESTGVVGEILSYMGTTAPDCFLACDGTVYNIAQYPFLAQHFIDNFGAVNFFGGNGTTTFAVPDLRGEFLRGTGTNSHVNSGNGAEVGKHQGATAVIAMQKFTNNYLCVGSVDELTQTQSPDFIIRTTSNKRINYAPLSTNDGDFPQGMVTVRPTNTSVLYCIRYKPAFLQDKVSCLENKINELSDRLVAQTTYSLKERQVGYWINGKPLYEKTIDFGTLPDSASKEVPHGIENIGLIWIHDGFAVNSDNGNTIQLVYPNVSSGQDVGFVCLVNSTTIRVQSQNNRSVFHNTKVVLRYTKATDKARES